MFPGNMWFLLEDQHHSKIHSLPLTVIQLAYIEAQVQSANWTTVFSWRYIPWLGSKHCTTKVCRKIKSLNMFWSKTFDWRLWGDMVYCVWVVWHGFETDLTDLTLFLVQKLWGRCSLESLSRSSSFFNYRFSSRVRVGWIPMAISASKPERSKTASIAKSISRVFLVGGFNPSEKY